MNGAVVDLPSRRLPLRFRVRPPPRRRARPARGGRGSRAPRRAARGARAAGKSSRVNATPSRRSRCRPAFARMLAPGRLRAGSSPPPPARSQPRRRSSSRSARSLGRSATKGDDVNSSFYVKHGSERAPGARPAKRWLPATRFASSTRHGPHGTWRSSASTAHVERASTTRTGEHAARVPAGNDVALPESTVLDDTLGDETIHGVFCAGAVRARASAGRARGLAGSRACARGLRGGGADDAQGGDPIAMTSKAWLRRSLCRPRRGRALRVGVVRIGGSAQIRRDHRQRSR